MRCEIAVRIRLGYRCGVAESGIVLHRRRNGIIVCVRENVIYVESRHVACLVYRPHVNDAHTCCLCGDKVKRKRGLVSVELSALNGDDSVEVRTQIACRRKVYVFAFDVKCAECLKLGKSLDHFHAVEDVDSACVIAVDDVVAERKVNAVRCVCAGVPSSSRRKSFVIAAKCVEICVKCVFTVAQKRILRSVRVDKHLDAALPVRSEITHRHVLLFDDFRTVVLTCVRRERGNPRHVCGGVDDESEHAFAINHFVRDGRGGLLQVGLDGYDDAVAVRLSRHQVGGVIFDKFADVVCAFKLACAVHNERMHRTRVFKHESVARETAARERKFQRSFARCPRAVLIGGNGDVFVLFVDVGQIQVVGGSVVVNLCIESLLTALVARKVEYVERKSVISVTGHVSFHIRRIALVVA